MKMASRSSRSESPSPSQLAVLMSLRPDGKAISFFGDLHPSFSGNVVKAMGGAKRDIRSSRDCWRKVAAAHLTEPAREVE